MYKSYGSKEPKPGRSQCVAYVDDKGQSSKDTILEEEKKAQKILTLGLHFAHYTF
jgi:hypothetical protein